MMGATAGHAETSHCKGAARCQTSRTDPTKVRSPRRRRLSRPHRLPARALFHPHPSRPPLSRAPHRLRHRLRQSTPPPAKKQPAKAQKKAPAKKAPAEKTPAKAAKKAAPAKKAAKKAPAEKAPPKKTPAAAGLADTNGDRASAAKEAAAQAKSTVATATNPVSGPAPVPLIGPEPSRLPIAAAIAAGVLAILVVLLARRGSGDG